MKVLVVEDDPVHKLMLEKLLSRWGYQVQAVTNGAEAIRLLVGDDSIQLVIADWMMPEMDGLDLCREIRNRGSQPYIYFILLTAKDQHDDVVAGLDAGADDYVIKPVHHSELNARIRAAKRIIDLQNQLLEAQERLRIQATHDALTGIWNRRAIFEALARELDRAERQEIPVAVVLIDLDHFKKVNDSHGHLVGDEVLRETAQRIRGAVRSYDAVGRYGGEEFLVVAPECDTQRAMDLAERIRLLLLQTPIETSGLAIPVTLSLGVVHLEKGSKIEINRVLSAADQALYRAKSSGRNQTVLGSL
jgi:two-component system cell cycle response regulator